MSKYDSISPIDYRYAPEPEETQKYFSESSMIRSQLRVELALVKILSKRGICDNSVYEEVKAAAEKVTAEEVEEEEKKTKHNIRALVNAIRSKVSETSKPYVHLTATSHDIICTAEALRFKELTRDVLLPVLIDLEKSIIELALREKETIQIGRTHGQHAEPITFGYAMAEYVSRLGKRIQKIKETSSNLRGKMSGAVGAYNASSLFFEDSQSFEKEIMAELGLLPSEYSTQIAEPEYMADYVHSLVSCFGVLANLADDMRNLQRTEIGETAERFESGQVGSSTMPHKRNPWHFENIKSLFKEFMPRMITSYLDQISEHQRDLTNSASSRFTIEICAGLLFASRRMTKYVSSLVVDKENMLKNFSMSKEFITAEPLYILLAYHNHPDAHEHVKQLTLKAQKENKKFGEIVSKDVTLKSYFEKFTKEQMEIIKNPEKYIGKAVEKTEQICDRWKKEV